MKSVSLRPWMVMLLLLCCQSPAERIMVTLWMTQSHWIRYTGGGKTAQELVIVEYSLAGDLDGQLFVPTGSSWTIAAP